MVSVIEYACTVWAPNSAQDINRIEMIQRRAARFVYHNCYPTASVSSMHAQITWLANSTSKKKLP